MNNFSTQVAIMAGLENHFVQKAMQKCWGQVTARERRTCGVFQTWCTAEDDFKYIRAAVDALEDNIKAGSHAPSVASGGAGKAKASMEIVPPSTCIPFVGMSFPHLFW